MLPGIFHGRVSAMSYAIPLHQASGWQLLTYNNIRPNQVSFSEQGIEVQVNHSASPLIYPLPAALVPEDISVSLQINGDLNLGNARQGAAGSDDFVFRLGLVRPGTKRLNFFQRAVAADWIRRLYELAPETTGIENIEFYTVYSDHRLANSHREHPLSDLVIEHFVAEKPDNGLLTLNIKPEFDGPVLALWISIDGDDTRSSYQVLVKELVISTR